MNLYWEAFIRLLFPLYCGVCPRLLELDETGVCSACRKTLEMSRFDADESLASLSLDCLDDVWSLYPYRTPVKELLGGIKYSGKTWLLKIFQSDMASAIDVIMAEKSYDALVPVPLEESRFRQREFNQSQLLANMITKGRGLRVEASWLKKRYSTFSQGRLTREERRINLRDSFWVKHPAKVEGKSILLVDDILTTGATAEEAARTLKAAGAGRIDLITLARTELTASTDFFSTVIKPSTERDLSL